MLSRFANTLHLPRVRGHPQFRSLNNDKARRGCLLWELPWPLPIRVSRPKSSGSGGAGVLVWTSGRHGAARVEPSLRSSRKSRPSIRRLKVVKLDVDDNPDVSARYRVQSIPTVILFKGGEEVVRHIGASPKQVIGPEGVEYL